MYASLVERTVVPPALKRFFSFIAPGASAWRSAIRTRYDEAGLAPGDGLPPGRDDGALAPRASNKSWGQSLPTALLPMT